MDFAQLIFFGGMIPRHRLKGLEIPSLHYWPKVSQLAYFTEMQTDMVSGENYISDPRIYAAKRIDPGSLKQ